MSAENKPMSLDSLVQDFFGLIMRNGLYIGFIIVLCMIYIWNNHTAQKLVTNINRKAKELKELRWDYQTINADLMYKSKLTEVMPRANELGLKELDLPPHKITLKKKEYQRQD